MHVLTRPNPTAGKASCDGTKPHQGIQDQANSTGAHLAQPRIPSPQLTPANVSNASVQPDCYPAPPPPPASNPTSPSHPFEYTHTPTTSNPAYDDTHTHYTHDIPDLNQGGRGDTGATFENDNLGRGYEGTRPRGGPVPLPHIEAEDGGVVDGEMNHRVEEQDRMDGGEGREGGESWPRAYSPMGGLPTGPGQAGKYGGANGLGVTV